MQQVLKDSTETLLFYPPELYQASAADVRIGTAAVGLPAVGNEEAATVDSVSTTTNAAAAKGTDSLSVADNPNVTPGRKYLVALDDGQRFTVRVIAYTSGGGHTVHLADPLPIAVPSGSALKGLAITHALTAAETASIGDGLAKVRATLNGVQRAFDVSFRVVNAILGLTLTPDRLVSAYPQVSRLRSSSDEDYTEAIDSAWEHLLRPELRARGFLEENINSPSELEPAHALAVIYRMTRAARPDDIERIEEARKDYKTMLDNVLNSSALWYSADDSDDNMMDGDGQPDFMVAWVTR